MAIKRKVRFVDFAAMFQRRLAHLQCGCSPKIGGGNKQYRRLYYENHGWSDVQAIETRGSR